MSKGRAGTAGSIRIFDLIRDHVRRVATIILVGLLMSGQALAHGTHATFLSPDKGARVSGELLVHVKQVPQALPYIHISVREASNDAEMWSGLVPVDEAGYVQPIDIAGWAAGDYVIEVQFLGDIVEQVQHRVVEVAASE